MHKAARLENQEDVQRTLGRIEGKLDALADNVLEHVKDDKVAFVAVDTRLRTMEYKIYSFAGALAIVSAALQYFK